MSINECKSVYVHNELGVPQGSILGPLLLIIYIYHLYIYIYIYMYFNMGGVETWVSLFYSLILNKFNRYKYEGRVYILTWTIRVHSHEVRGCVEPTSWSQLWLHGVCCSSCGSNRREFYPQSVSAYTSENLPRLSKRRLYGMITAFRYLYFLPCILYICVCTLTHITHKH